MKHLLFLAAALVFAGAVRAGEPFLKPNDVIALVGGEDMVAASEYGYLELLLIRALPRHHLRFRNLAWEGDTVFEQRRDLNFPPLEDQLEKIGATVVLVHFGKMEALLPQPQSFQVALTALYDRIAVRRGGRERRVVLLFPTPFEDLPGAPLAQPAAVLNRDSDPQEIIDGRGGPLAEIGLATAVVEQGERCYGLDLGRIFTRAGVTGFTRDGIHLNERGHAVFARAITAAFLDNTWSRDDLVPDLSRTALPLDRDAEPLRQVIRARNRLWSNYWRPQNWAFLAGDRTNQPSSRDHLDPSKRWFPDEIEQFIPLIKAKEREIDALAVRLAKP
ncbi:MAG: hypothetical protein QOE70_282 [Chthoniobacter sp.]|jgi:hypothetical protein|nr:hypothetical protein [Chthoniobacter sp.]